MEGWLSCSKKKKSYFYTKWHQNQYIIWDGEKNGIQIQNIEYIFIGLSRPQFKITVSVKKIELSCKLVYLEPKWHLHEIDQNFCWHKYPFTNNREW